MKRKILCLVLVLALISTVFIGLVACDDAQTPATPDNGNGSGGTISGTSKLTVTDSLNRTLLVDVDAIQKVVCIGAGSLRLYSYVADLNKLCAVEDIEKTRSTEKVSYRAYQIANEDFFATLPSAGAGGPDSQSLNIELLADLEPDIIFSCLSSQDVIDQLETAERTIGCPIVTLKYGQQKAFSQDVLDSITLIGKIMKCETRAKEITDYMSALKADIASKAEGKTSAKIYLACNSNWGVKGFLSTSKNYPIFTISGIDNVMDDGSYTINDKGKADMEAVIASDAEKIILDAGGLGEFKKEYEEPGSTYPGNLATMDAFANKEVYLMMPNNAYDANVETYFINAYYALNVAYGLDINIREKAGEILTTFVGKNVYDDIITYGGYQKLNLPDVWPEK